jgi:hypothetical protein
VLLTFSLGWLGTVILLISISLVVAIIEIPHYAWPLNFIYYCEVSNIKFSSSWNFYVKFLFLHLFTIRWVHKINNS